MLINQVTWKGRIKGGENCGIIAAKGATEKRYKVRHFFQIHNKKSDIV